MLEKRSLFDTDSPVAYAFLGHRGKRVAAYVIDIFPIMFMTILVYQNFFDSDSVMEAWMLDPQDPENKAAFISLSSNISLIALILYILYAIVMESSIYQATWGKRLVGLKVVRQDGQYITPTDALWRNAFKVISSLVWNMGFFWILFDQRKRGWHDLFAKTLVVDADYELEEIKTPSESKPTFVESEPEDFLSIYDGNQTNLLYQPNYSKDDLKALKEIYINPIDDHLLWHYAVPINDELIEQNMDIDDGLYWNNRTKGQKALSAFIIFDGMVKQFGIRQLISASPKNIFAIGEALELFGLDELLAGYNRIITNPSSYPAILTNSKALKDAIDQWGERQLPPIIDRFADLDLQGFDNIYREPDFYNPCYDRICTYIEEHLDQFVR